MKITTTPGGILLVEEETPAQPPAVPGGLKCAFCDKRSADERMPPIGWETSDGFDVWWPRCKDGKFITCKECEGKALRCPVCGTGEFYC